MVRIIAFYLPQYHPIKQNDKWWGKGFTEWTNVARARSLFPGHKQPHIPADLGFYDLRYPEIKEEQVKLAKEAGIEAFCYYHYWFGNNEQIMEKPFNDVLSTGKPKFPFCLCWANHSFYKKNWDLKAKNVLLAEQKYLGEEDDIKHFYSLLPAFRDYRYLKVNGRCFFFIYDPLAFPNVADFLKLWRRLAKENGLNDFYFVCTDSDSRNKNYLLSLGFDAICNVDILNVHHHLNIFSKVFLYILRNWFKIPSIFSYKKAIKYMISKDSNERQVIPTIVPNWDHTPRSGGKGTVLFNSNPELFKVLAKKAIDVVKNKPVDEQIIMLKSWNEWGEGNYMEPDLEFGHGYINALKDALQNK